jgi:Family of unknown function (DUF5694)
MKRMLLFATALAMVPACWSQSQSKFSARPEILVLGTYHMANPGQDVFNMHADSVLSPKRQQEIVQLIEVLKKFHPTKIAIEASVESQHVGQQYADYLAGKYTLSGDEVDQVAFRLAKELALQTVYPVDEQGDFPYERLVNWAVANGRKAQFDAMQASMGVRVKDENDFLLSHTVLQMFEYINSDSMVSSDVASYFAFVPYGDPDDYAGSDLIASWYQRNIRIYRNIVALIGSPNDRILVIFGAGHLGWLRQDAANDATVRLRKLAEYTSQQ